MTDVEALRAECGRLIDENADLRVAVAAAEAAGKGKPQQRGRKAPAKRKRGAAAAAASDSEGDDGGSGDDDASPKKKAKGGAKGKAAAAKGAGGKGAAAGGGKAEAAVQKEVEKAKKFLCKTLTAQLARSSLPPLLFSVASPCVFSHPPRAPLCSLLCASLNGLHARAISSGPPILFSLRFRRSTTGAAGAGASSTPSIRIFPRRPGPS